jgi:xylulokinase
MSQYLLGIDIGTQNSKGILVNLEGEIFSKLTLGHNISIPQKSWAEHNAEKIWWSDFKKICRSLIKQAQINAKDIVAIGCSGLAPTMLPVDKNGKPLRRAILYGIDTRSSEEIKWINQILGKDEIFKISGQALSTQSVGPKILWFKKHEPQKFKETHKILSTNSFLIYKLTGKYAIDMSTAIFFGPLFNFQKMKWGDKICDEIGIPFSILPNIYYPAKVVGEVTSKASKETGLSIGTPVIAGAPDTFAEATGSGAIKEGEVFLVYGTTMTIIACLKYPKTHIKLWSNIHYVPNIFTLLGGMATSGALTRWFKDNFAQDDVESEKKTGISVYHLLSEKAAKISIGSEGLIVLPYFSGERTPIDDELARGVIMGLTLSHTRKHLYRALLEGTAYGVEHHLDIMREMSISPKKIIAAGGGAENHTWTQIVSDVTGLKQICIKENGFSAPYGDAYMAGYGAGLFKDFTTLREKWVKIIKTIEPNLKAHKEYKEYYRVYRKLYNHIKEDIHKLAELSLKPL